MSRISLSSTFINTVNTSNDLLSGNTNTSNYVKYTSNVISNNLTNNISTVNTSIVNTSNWILYNSNVISNRVSTKQDIITGAASTIVNNNLASGYALITDASGKVGIASNIPISELNYLDGVTSAIQTQIDAKQNTLTAGTNISIVGNTINSTTPIPWTITGNNVYYNTGNVGIGTTSVTNPLFIYTSFVGSSFKIQNTSTNYSAIELMNNNAKSTSLISIGSGGSSGLVDGDFGIYINSAMRFNIQYSTGNIGLATTNPPSLLTVGAQVVDRDVYNHSEAPLTITNQTATSTTVLNDPKSVLHLCRQGTNGQAQGARATFKICRWENNAANSRTRLDMILSHAIYDDVNIMSLRSDGNVGIGNTSPSYKLDVNGNGQFVNSSVALNVVNSTPTSATVLNDPQEVLMLSRKGTGSQSVTAAAIFSLSRWENPSWDARSRMDISLRHNGIGANTSVMTMWSSGLIYFPWSVGIGTSAITSGFKMEVMSQGANTIFNTASTTYSSYIGFKNTTDSKTCYIGVDGVGLNNFEKGALLMGPWTDNSIIFTSGSTNTEKMRIKSNGNVGIGTTNPITILHLQRSGADNYIKIDAGGTNANYGGIMFCEHNINYGHTIRYNANTDALEFLSQDSTPTFTNRMTININGRVGIGNTAPSKLFQVAPNSQGAISIVGSGDVRYHCFNGGGIQEWIWGQKSSTSHNWILSTLNSGNETDRLTVDTSGNVFSYGAIFPSALHLSSVNTIFGITDEGSYRKIQSWGSKPLSINPSGNYVGIAKTDPGYTLDVNGDINYNYTLRKNGVDILNTKPTRFVFWVAQSGTSGSNYIFDIDVSGVTYDYVKSFQLTFVNTDDLELWGSLVFGRYHIMTSGFAGLKQNIRALATSQNVASIYATSYNNIRVLAPVSWGLKVFIIADS